MDQDTREVLTESEFDRLLTKIDALKCELSALVPDDIRERVLQIVEELETLSAQAEEEAR